jgi:hypothetical protein
MSHPDKAASPEAYRTTSGPPVLEAPNLRAEMIDVEALARAAEAAADALPAPVTERQRLVFGRIQSLVTKTSQQASASLRFANAQVTAFTAHLAAGRDRPVPE